MQDSLHAARVLMSDSLGFHIIFVMFGLTLPILVVAFEFMAIRRKDKDLMNVAQFLSKIMGLLVITGVISGVIIALQMSLVWPGILKFGGEVIGLPFMFETYAFLIEATFLALYLARWKKASPWVHWFYGVMVVIGSTLSAYAITSVNAWMNYPAGFDYVNGKIENVNVWGAMFSRTSIVEFVHSMPAYYFAASLMIMSIYIVRILKNPKASHKLNWFVVKKIMIFAGIMFIALGITADISGKYLANYEPAKLAALELNYETRSNAPLLVGGVGKEDGTIVGPHFEIPGALSLLAGNSTSTVVQGLNETPKEHRPSLVIHTLFDVKMTIVNVLMVVIPGYFVLMYFKKEWLKKRIVLLLLGVSGYLGLVVVELGWMITEIGRQPWAVRGYVLTKDAFTTSSGVTAFGFLFPLAYVGLFAGTIYGLKRILKSEKQKNERTA